MKESLHLFVTALNTRVSASLGELGLVISRTTNQVNRSFLPAAVRL